MKIPVVVVDDQEVDRYLARRCLSKVEDFDELIEVSSGTRFLEQFFSNGSSSFSANESLLVLMDINMPGLDGFQTIEEVQYRMLKGLGPSNVVFMMFTSSDNQQDRDKAGMLDMVKGYLSKPIDEDSIRRVRDLYLSLAA